MKIIDLKIESDGDNVRHQLELNKSNLKKVMLHSEVKDRPVVIVSIAGACKTGKSFLLEFFLKYLETKVIFFKKSLFQNAVISLF